MVVTALLFLAPTLCKTPQLKLLFLSYPDEPQSCCISSVFLQWGEVIQFAMQAELRMTQGDQHLAVPTEKGVQYSCTVNSAGGRQEIALWDSQC